ncbi:MAG: Rab family GTPase [Promethearchaeota archaeon]
MYDASFKIIMFGDPKVGKNTIIQRFLTNLFKSDQTMTIGVDFEVKSLIVDGKKVKLQIWYFDGEERFRFLLPTYVRGAKGGMFLYDMTNYSSLAHIDDWLSVIRKEIRAEDKFPIIVVGNKADLVEERVVPSADGIKIAKSRGVNGFIETSSKTGENVEKAFEALTRLMLGGYGPRRVGVKHEIIDEIGLEQVKESIQRYLNLKSKTNKQITRARTIKAIKKSLKLAGKDQSWDDDIWAFTISLSKSICKRITPKTIYFQ